MKTKPYEKPISTELATLIRKAIAYTKEKYGDTPYIFVDEKDTTQAVPYTTIQFRVTNMIYKKDLRDDNGNLFGFGTHIYRHCYGVKLTEMHPGRLDNRQAAGTQQRSQCQILSQDEQPTACR